MCIFLILLRPEIDQMYCQIILFFFRGFFSWLFFTTNGVGLFIYYYYKNSY